MDGMVRLLIGQKIFRNAIEVKNLGPGLLSTKEKRLLMKYFELSKLQVLWAAQFVSGSPIYCGLSAPTITIYCGLCRGWGVGFNGWATHNFLLSTLPQSTQSPVSVPKRKKV